MGKIMSLLVKEKNFYRTFFALTFAIALQNVIVYTVNLADNVMLGRYAEEALSGAALVNQIQFLLQMMVTGVAEGALIFGARAWGRSDLKCVKNITAISVKSGILVSSLLGLACLIFPSQILYILSNNDAVVAEGVIYLKILCWSYPIFALSQTLLSMLRSVETVMVGFVTALVTLVCNVVLNYIFIFGAFGIPSMGVAGAAYATLASRIIECLIVLVYVFCIDKKVKMRPRDLIPFDKLLFKDYFKTGSPVFVSGVLWGVAQMLQTAILGHTTAAAIAANSISSTVFSIVSVVTYASATATSVIIGKAIGEGKMYKLKPYSKTLQLLFLAIGIATGLLLFILRGPINAIYNVSPEAKVLSDRFMLILAVTVVGTSYQMAVHTGIVRAGGDTSFVFKVDTIFMWCLVLPLSFLSAFVFKWPIPITFFFLKSDQLIKCIVAYIKVNHGNWIKVLK